MGWRRRPTPWLGLALLASCTDGCRGRPPADTDTGSSGMATMAGASSTATEDACPEAPRDGGYDPCPGACGEQGQCLADGESFAVCTRGCFTDCDCWPSDGEATARCSDALTGVPICVLDCSAGQACPAGTWCVEALGVCAHPWVGGEDSTGSGSTTGGSGSSSDGGSSSSTDGGSSSSSASSTTDQSSSGSETGSSSGSETSSSGGTITTTGMASSGSSSGT